MVKSCRFIEHGIFFRYFSDDALSVKHCCNMDSLPEDEQLYLIKEYKGGALNWQELFENKRKLRDDCRKGIYNPACLKCWELKEMETDEEDYFSEVMFSHITKCNSRCVYCYIGNHENMYNAEEKFDMLPIIKDMQDKNIIRYTGSLRYMGGEPTLMKDFEEITNLFAKNNIPEIYLPTSGIKYSKAMGEACKTVPFCNIFISIDSGCRETYKKIKGLDAYNLAFSSLKKYAQNREIKGHIISKYIILPELNDNTTEIDKWAEASKSIELTDIAPDVEYSYIFDKSKEVYLKHILNMVKYAEKKIQSLGMHMNNSVVYRKMLEQWAEDNKEKLLNDTTDEIFEINITDLPAEKFKDILLEIIDKNTMWHKPKIKITADKDVTDYTDFDKILYHCISLGFKTIVETNNPEKSSMITEALKISDIEILSDNC